MTDLAGKVVVVTGAARGIGQAIALACLEAGAAVGLIDVVSCDETISQFPAFGTWAASETDVASREGVSAAFDALEHALGPVSGLVNNAGIGAHGTAISCSDEEWTSVMDTHLRGMWLCAQRVLPSMKKAADGSIVNVSSIHAAITAGGYFPYPAAKAGVEGMTRAMAVEEGPFGIRVNSLAPGWTSTHLTEEQFDKATDPAAERRRVALLHPLHRIVSTSEVAAAALFLLSDNATGITGARLLVDAGLSARFAV